MIVISTIVISLLFSSVSAQQKQSKSHDQAISDFTKAIEMNPRYYQAYYNRGIVYGNKGQYDQAISDYNKAIEINPRFAQAYYNMKEGIERLATETGAGQWGSALSLATCLFDLKCTVYMVRTSYDSKPYRRSAMRVWGAECLPSPSDRTNFGRKVLSETPNTPGSLGIAISEAVEDAGTFAGNATRKAVALARWAGVPVLVHLLAPLAAPLMTGMTLRAGWLGWRIICAR